MINDKDKRKLAIQRKKNDKLKRNSVIKDLHSNKYHQRIVETKEKGGSKNLVQEYYNKEEI